MGSILKTPISTSKIERKIFMTNRAMQERARNNEGMGRVRVLRATMTHQDMLNAPEANNEKKKKKETLVEVVELGNTEDDVPMSQRSFRRVRRCNGEATAELKKKAQEMPRKKKEMKAHVPSSRSKTKVVDGKWVKGVTTLSECGLTAHLSGEAMEIIKFHHWEILCRL